MCEKDLSLALCWITTKYVIEECTSTIAKMPDYSDFLNISDSICFSWQLNSISRMTMEPLNFWEPHDIWQWIFQQMWIRGHETRNRTIPLICKLYTQGKLTNTIFTRGKSKSRKDLTINPEHFRMKPQQSHRKLFKSFWNAGLQITERALKCELGHITSPNLLRDVMTSTSKHSFKSFW